MIIRLAEEWSTYKKLLFLKAMGGGALSEYEITGNPVAFNTNVAKALTGFTIPFLPVQSGTGDPSPENIRPISGWTGLTAWRTGKNLLPNLKCINNNNVFFGTSEMNGVNTHSITLPSGTYTLTVETRDGTDSNLYVAKVGVVLFMARKLNTKTLMFTIEETTALRIWAYKSGYIDVGTGAITSFQLEPGETASSYAEYTGESYPVTFPDGQTIYGGTLDAVSRVLTVTQAMKDLGSLNYTMQSGSDNVNVFTTAGFGDKKLGVTNIISDLFATTSVTSWGSTKPNNSICGSASSTTVVIRADAYADVNSLKTALDGHTAVYELATPYEIQLDPITVQTLIGDNTIWTDTNGENTVRYKKKG